MKKHRSKKDWLREHHTDPWVKRARKEGWRSRAAYKLLEIDKRDRLLQPGMVVVDLGAAPGGWSQVAAQRVGKQGCVIALDLLAMPDVDGVHVIQGDMNDDESIALIMELLGERPVDLVISDMAPNISGMDAIDQPRSVHLAELTADFAFKVLRPGGDLLLKIFQGAGTESFRDDLRRNFNKVVIRKPDASRARSREIYLLARGHAPNPGTAVG